MSECIQVNNWPEYTLNEVFSFASGLSKSREEFGYGFPFLSFKEVFQNFFLPRTLQNLANTTEKERMTCSIRRGDVFLTRTSETQEELGMSSVALMDYPNATFNGFTKRLRPLGNIDIWPEYAGFYFRSPQFRAAITSMSSITTRASLNNDMMSALKIVLPPLEEQKAIASVLSSLDDKIDLLHRQNKTLEAIAETLFRQWFVEEAQDDWKEKLLGDFFEISSGKGLRKERLIEDGLYPVLGANGEIGRTNDFLFDEKLLFTGRVGTLGNIFIVDNKKVWLSDNTLVFRKIQYFYFVYFTLKLTRLADYNAGSTQPLIRQSDIKEISILSPINAKLDIFEEQAKSFFMKIKSNNNQIRTLETLRDTLLPKLMSGEVRVDYP